MPRFVSFRNESGMGKKSGEHLLHLFITGDADKEWLLLRIQKKGSFNFRSDFLSVRAKSRIRY